MLGVDQETQGAGHRIPVTEFERLRIAGGRPAARIRSPPASACCRWSWTTHRPLPTTLLLARNSLVYRTGSAFPACIHHASSWPDNPQTPETLPKSRLTAACSPPTQLPSRGGLPVLANRAPAELAVASTADATARRHACPQRTAADCRHSSAKPARSPRCQRRIRSALPRSRGRDPKRVAACAE